MTKLTPELLLFEVACMLSRHGIPASSDNPSAAVDAATRMLRALGVPVEAPEPLAITSTANMPAVIDERVLGPTTPTHDQLGAPLIAPSPLASLPTRFDRGRAEVGQHRVLRLAPSGGEHA